MSGTVTKTLARLSSTTQATGHQAAWNERVADPSHAPMWLAATTVGMSSAVATAT